MADLGRFLMQPAFGDSGLSFDGKGFRHLVTDPTPNYTDTESFPTAKTIWTNQAIYRADDAQVGRWSQTVSVTVG